jgi:hypothetical protein
MEDIIHHGDACQFMKSRPSEFTPAMPRGVREHRYNRRGSWQGHHGGGMGGGTPQHVVGYG